MTNISELKQLSDNTWQVTDLDDPNLKATGSTPEIALELLAKKKFELSIERAGGTIDNNERYRRSESSTDIETIS